MNIAKTFAAVALAAGLIAGPALAKDKITVGVTPGAHEEILEQVQKLAKEQGVNVEIATFSDYVVPNQALNDGDLDLNSFQHVPYLDNQIADRGYKLTAVGKTIITPMGIYSNKIDNLDALPKNARVAIPNDPTNGGRALLLLQKQGVIKLADGVGLKATPLDIVENPKNIDILELDAAQLPRVLNDVAVAAINTNYALDAGLDPVADSIAIESADSPYANVIVSRTEDKDADWVKQFVEIYQSDEIRDFIEKTYGGAVVPVF
ncbi:MetQ/NlpA family ABC transporter substrate-binding protein [Martelella mediterranea]|uniref:D-methionine transport system substrate-binding protein n=1 Tax=Martelella mediterranea TaxID=293089 RepID=A0A4R3NNH2_9HYPH|nr:MetQ/NlpA family ABC transporter substrate-binding protein [Martelella mediterranea]TCT36299.1 D-methionine transport system substrate-binding protein [Martelella mediterranea]